MKLIYWEITIIIIIFIIIGNFYGPYIKNQIRNNPANFY